MLGPVGSLLTDAMFPPAATATNTQQPTPPRKLKKKNIARGRNFDIPPSGEARFVDNEPARAHVASDAIGTQSFSLTGRTISRWHIDGGRSVADTLRLIRRDFPGLTAGQANKLYVGAQTELAVRPDAVPDGAAAQYVVRKLHLLEAHRINKGDDVLVAVIHSQKRSHCQNELCCPADPNPAGDAAQGQCAVHRADFGNAGPNSPPLYPAADATVIGVTATDAEDRLKPQANRGPQVFSGCARG
jgi:hypothetical protein